MKWKKTTKSNNSLSSKNLDLAWQVWTFDNLSIKVSILESHCPFPKNRLEIEKKKKIKGKKRQKIKVERRKQNKLQELICLSFFYYVSLYLAPSLFLLSCSNTWLYHTVLLVAEVLLHLLQCCLIFDFLWSTMNLTLECAESGGAPSVPKLWKHWVTESNRSNSYTSFIRIFIFTQ